MNIKQFKRIRNLLRDKLNKLDVGKVNKLLAIATILDVDVAEHWKEEK